MGTFWTQEKQYSSLYFLTTEHLRALIKNHEVRSPFVTLFSLAVHSRLESQSYTSTLFSTSEKWDRARTLSLFHFRISEAGGISSKGNSNYLLLELMLAFLIHQSLLRCSQQSWCLLPMCTSAYVWCVYACVYVCICACKPPHQQEEGPTFLGGQFPYWLRLSPQTHSAFPPIGFYNVSLKHY